MKKIGAFIILRNRRCCRGLPAARLLLLAVLVAAAIGGLTTSGQACGTAFHHEVVDMAYNALDSLAYPALANLLSTTYQGAIDAGAVFPDMGYGRPADQAYWEHLSEDAHGSQFRQKLIEYLVPTFRALPGTEDDRKTLTFMLGVIAHQEADNPYHFGRDGAEGLLPAGMRIDGNDHTTVEVGSDVFVNVEYGQGGTEDAWWTPLSAARAAYLAIGHDVVESQMGDGMLALASAHTAIKAIGYPTYLAYLIDLSWTHANLSSYAVGGLQDGANKTALAWQSAWDWMSTYRLYLPLVGNGTAAPGALAVTGPPVSTGQLKPGDSLAHDPRLMLFGQKLLDEGVVRVRSRMENGNLIIEQVEVLDHQRLNQIAEQTLGAPAEEPSR